MCCAGGNSLHSLICVAVASFAVLAQPAVAQGTNTTLPLTYSGQILQGDGSQRCPSEAQQERVRNEVDSEILRLVRESVVPLLQATQTQLPTQPSTQCPTDYSCGGSTGWRRVVYLNMSAPSQQCPSMWREITTPHRVCGRRSTTDASCEGLNYSTGSAQYNQVCGRIIGYQFGNTNSFLNSSWSVDTYYVDGVSVTHGSPANTSGHSLMVLMNFPHISPMQHVPVSLGALMETVFVGQNYFCESGLTLYSGSNHIFHPDSDPLWDGEGCGPTSSCCTFHSPPWFNVTLSSPTTDNIEVRICDRASIQNSDTLIQLMELYVK